MNYHLTETGHSRSVGTTEDGPGFYPADDANAESIVAPGEFVEEWLVANDEQPTDDAIASAVRVWWREHR